MDSTTTHASRKGMSSPREQPTTSDNPATSTSRTATEQLLAWLHRDGTVAHLWTDAGNRSYWFAVGEPSAQPVTRYRAKQAARLTKRRVPKGWSRHNIYFTVHPLSQIPPRSTNGRTNRRYISSQSEYICAINTLFAEFDGKDYVYSLEYGARLLANFRELTTVEQRQAVSNAKERLFYRAPARYKQRALHQIEALDYPPSVIVDSGGGYHCYWLLRETVPIDESNRDDVQAIQHGWVQIVDGDRGAADLRRVLRLPGSFNHKQGFGTEPPRVDFVKVNFDLLYDYQRLEEVVSDWLYAERRARMERMRKRRTGSSTQSSPLNRDPEEIALRQQFNATHDIATLLTTHGYRLCSAHGGQIRLARPGRDRLHSSVTVFPAQEGGLPERSIHFSTNDPLYSREYIDAKSGKVRRRLYDAFALYVLLEHGGNWEAGYHAVAEGVGSR